MSDCECGDCGKCSRKCHKPTLEHGYSPQNKHKNGLVSVCSLACLAWYIPPSRKRTLCRILLGGSPRVAPAATHLCICIQGCTVYVYSGEAQARRMNVLVYRGRVPAREIITQRSRMNLSDKNRPIRRSSSRFRVPLTINQKPVVELEAINK